MRRSVRFHAVWLVGWSFVFVRSFVRLVGWLVVCLVGWLIVRLFVCLVVWSFVGLVVWLGCWFGSLVATGLCKTYRRWRGLNAARASSRGNGLSAVCCAGVRRACTGAPPIPVELCRTTALRHCVMRRVPPKRRVLCCHRVESGHESPRRRTRLHVNTRSRTSARP